MWTCARQTSELNELKPHVVAPFIQAQMVNGEIVSDKAFRRAKQRTNQFSIASSKYNSVVPQYRNAIKDANLHSRKIMSTKEQNKLADWRKDMKDLEDIKSERAVYQRIGKNDKTLL